MIPKWLIEARKKICSACHQQVGCVAKLQILSDAPTCPLELLPSKSQIVFEKAWPAGATLVSGCCDSAQNYLSHTPR
jgi:hypothetical protein